MTDSSLYIELYLTKKTHSSVSIYIKKINFSIFNFFINKKMANSKLLCTLIWTFLALNGVNSHPTDTNKDTLLKAYFHDLYELFRTSWAELDFLDDRLSKNPNITILELQDSWDDSYGSSYGESSSVMRTMTHHLHTLEKNAREFRKKLDYIAKKSSENADSKIKELLESKL
ncbi:GSCOCG00005637001-RA-CDS [Cotesia congregata]|uniref:Uncharacterized protein n=1 Tax=Cotesia congregata TaxID=51543 RepID=A0A8J2HIV5_COTCN|nr:GSCOCG00005637001-RA-CDS [Cotesia congregata]CAG5099719.1 Protein of unknown function [Cotesia congregata]